MKKIITCASVLMAVVFTSCTDFLDIKPYGKTIPQSAEEFSALLHTTCQKIDEGSDDVLMCSSRMALTFEEMSDNMETCLTEYPAGRMLTTYMGENINNRQSDYTRLYEHIRTANIILGEFKEDRNTQEAKDLIGTAYAMRGVAYYQLMRMFCAPPLAEDGNLGVPLVTEFDMEAKPARASMEATIKQIESDLNAAIQCDIQEDMYRFNTDVMEGYLARLYHWCGRWSEARQISHELLQKHPMIDVLDDYRKMMSTQDGLCGNMLIKTNRMSTNMDVSLQYLTARPYSVRYTGLFEEKSADTRWNFFFNRKRKARTSAPYKLPFAGMRSAEFAFIAMESAYHLGNEEEALQVLNDFRAKRIKDCEAFTMQTLPGIREDEYIKEDCYGKPLTKLLYNILRERRKEFLMENGDRFFELKRNGRPEWTVYTDGMAYRNEKYMYTFPINVQDFAVQPSLIQNPGYEKTY